MSDLLTHWAVFEDCRRISARDAGVDPLLAEIMEDQREFARLGAISRGGGWFVPHILKTARGQWKAGGDREMLKKRIAFALGAITHYAADKVMKSVMRVASGRAADDGRSPPKGSPMDLAYREASAYFDVKVFREVYLSGEEEPFNQFLLQHNNTSAGQALEQFIMSLFQRSLLSSHTFDPDKGVGQEWEGNFDGWLDNLFSRVQPLFIDINLYTGIFANPDPAKMKKYGVETTFYVKTDPIVALARSLQRGEPVTDEQVAAAVNSDANGGAYAKILALSQSRLRDASAYWLDESGMTPDVWQG